MALWIAEAGLTLARYSFMWNLLSQLSNPQWPSHLDYVYSPDYMWNNGTTYNNGVEQVIPPACVGGPEGTLPEFDFIVVGSGPGGSVVANKLALAFPTRTTLLIEAGPEAPINVAVPGMFALNLKIEGTAAYHANQNPNYGNAYINGIKNDVGRALGGTTNLNAFIWVCGVDEDYNYLANITNDASWNYENMRPYIKSVFTMKDESIASRPECDGYQTSGNLRVGSYDNDEIPIIPLIQTAADVAGYENREDYNCGKWTGFIRLRGSLYEGERQSAAKAFLTPLRGQKNLMILQNAVVDKVITEQSNSSGKIKVKGVRVVTENEECPSFELKAKREIVLSAGAYNTPLILQRSGIGRAADLKPFNIPQKLDLNVGHNFKDHVMSVQFVTLPSEPSNEEALNNEVYRYFVSREGQFSYLSTADLDAFVNVYDPTSNHPNIQWVFFTFARQQNEFRHIMEYTFEFKSEYIDQMEAWNQDHALILFCTVLLKPKSSGYVGLRSTDPFDKPNIDSNFFSVEEDLQTMVDGIKGIKDFANSPVMASVGSNFTYMHIAECDLIEYDTNDYWKCYLKYFTQTLWHPAGTASMGQASSGDAVVDNRLKVIGVQGEINLRVSDASPFPDQLSSNVQCPIYSLAAKAAAMIIEDNQ